MTTDPLEFIPETGPRTLWVFALDISPDELPAWEADGAREDWPLPAALGVDHLDPAHVEVFPVDRISEYGLSRYLTEASGMADIDVDKHRDTLDAAEGVIVIVHGRAIRGYEGDLGAFAPKPPARFLGRFSEKVSLQTSPVQPGPKLSQGTLDGRGAPTPNYPWFIIGIAIVALVVLGIILWGLV